ncbi:MAG: DUF5682 family protein [Saezia sp.]
MNAPHSTVSYYGIRHHGPGCAASLRKALSALQPDCIVIEGPTGSEDLLQFLKSDSMRPPVALLTYSTEEPRLSVFHPFAVFSPEWQAIVYAQETNTPVRFMDLPPAISLALRKEQEAKVMQEADKTTEATPEEADEPALTEKETTPPENISQDPLDWLAHAAGYSDGESWWNHMVEERGDGTDLFDAIAHAMTELRDNAPTRSAEYEAREAMREAHMRLEIKQAQKDGFKRIAVVCGAWHVPALKQDVKSNVDKETLKGLPKIKTQTTWVPWTYQHLSSPSGYAAGVTAPGWYEYLWQVNQNHEERAIGWFVRIARLLREHELDCSSAHLIESVRLADTLAAMRERPAPSLAELHEAALSVICNGNEAPMQLIERELMIGNALGSIPTDVPTVPLQQDLQTQQKSLRFKPEALRKDIDLDLRKENDLARSHLLHQLNLLGIEWGTLTHVGQKAKGTFHEYWSLAWQPAFEVDIIIASRYGYSVTTAATALCTEKAQAATRLAELTELMDKVLLANLPQAVRVVASELQERSVGSADPIDLLNALPALANVYRYGNVRQTDVALVAHLFDNMLQRAVIALPLAVSNINADAAESVRETLLATERAINLRSGEEQTQIWRQALQQIVATQSTSALLRGTSCRLLFDAGVYTLEQSETQLSLNLSSAAEPEQAAHWLDGFLNRNATILIHNDHLWVLIDDWLSNLSDEHFINTLPLVRRTFSQFEAADRRDLGLKAQQEKKQLSHVGTTIAAHAESSWDEKRVYPVRQTLSELLGIPVEPFNTKKED